MPSLKGTSLTTFPTRAVPVTTPVVTIISCWPEKNLPSVSAETIMRVITRALTTYTAFSSVRLYQHEFIEWAYAEGRDFKVFGGILEERLTGKRGFWTLDPRNQNPVCLGLVP